jgi:hypothetical protein
MGWTQRYKKVGCTAGKEVNFANIATIAKVKVPPMMVGAFMKKVGAAKAPFDVFVEVDDAAGKGRILVKKIPPGDIAIEWADRSGPDGDAVKNLLKVKAELTSLNNTNATYLKSILAEKEKVKALKEGIKAIEGEVGKKPMTETALAIQKVSDQIAAVAVAGKQVQEKHNGWYLSGPRDGIAPILKKFGVDAKSLQPADSDALAKALHQMSADANQVRAVYDVDIRTATDALLLRLKNLQTTLAKGNTAALGEIRKTLAAEVEKVREQMTKGENEMKLAKTEELMRQLKDPASVAYKRLKANPSTVKAEMESNKVRTGNIPKYLDLVSKGASRLKKGIPGQFLGDPEIVKMFAELDKIEAQNSKVLAAGKAMLLNCDQELIAFGKG